MRKYYIKHRPPGSPLWHDDGPYPSRQVALYRRSELRRAGHEVRLETYRPPRPWQLGGWAWVLGAAVVAILVLVLLRGGC